MEFHAGVFQKRFGIISHCSHIQQKFSKQRYLCFPKIWQLNMERQTLLTPCGNRFSHTYLQDCKAVFLVLNAKKQL